MLPFLEMGKTREMLFCGGNYLELIFGCMEFEMLTGVQMVRGQEEEGAGGLRSGERSRLEIPIWELSVHRWHLKP